jgi:hypothetical protein
METVHAVVTFRLGPGDQIVVGGVSRQVDPASWPGALDPRSLHALDCSPTIEESGQQHLATIGDGSGPSGGGRQLGPAPGG